MSHYLVGIDLGTTHTVVAYVQSHCKTGKLNKKPAPIQLLNLPQLVAPGQVAAQPLLPSVRYHAAEGELAPTDCQLPWPTPVAAPGEPAQPAPPVVLGQWARQLGAQVPGRLVSSAKSWLSHPGVDRQAAILPWGAAADVPKVSPLEASASYLRHVRDAWNQQFPDHPLAQQDLVLTVPASFDEGARALTLSAARLAGLPTLRLLEEPQAVFYDWLLRHRNRLSTELAESHLVLVCDIGGGTTDLSLIQVELIEGEPKLTRIGVGNHLMLGGDNMDLALAHLLETRLTATATANPQRLTASQLAQLIERCRVAKEQLLAPDAPAQLPVTLLGGGSRLIGGSRTTTLTRQEVEQLVVDGFFPQVAASDTATQARKGLVEFGLPYARDPAVTRHLADFLRQFDHAMPDTLLLNGGVFRAEALVKRLAQTLQAWRGAPLHLLHNDNPDVAVARGAVAYGLAQHGLAPKIGGGSPRSYFLLLDEAGGKTQAAKSAAQSVKPATQVRVSQPDVVIAKPDVLDQSSELGRSSSSRDGEPSQSHAQPRPLKEAAESSGRLNQPIFTSPRGICILPRGSDVGEDVLLANHTFALRLGQPVRFQLFSTVADAAEHTPFELGDQVSLADERFIQLPPIATVLEAASAGGISARGQKGLQELPVQLVSVLTEVGTLEVHCQSLADAHSRWLLAFDLRHPSKASAVPNPSTVPAAPAETAHRASAQAQPSVSRVSLACQKIDRVFGPGGAALPSKDVKQLRQQLEAILGERARWATPELRQLFDALWQHARGRKRSAEHERAWLNLAGFCLRPGFGDPLDGWRLQQLWTQFEAGVQHSKDKQVCAEWWTLWRRVAGGLAAPEQLRLLDDFGYNLHTNERGQLDGTARPVKGSDDDMLRLGAALERIPVDYKQEIGDWLMARLQKSLAASTKQPEPDNAGDSLALWALGRIGAREPLHGTSHEVVPAEAAALWIQVLLALDWRRLESAAFAAVHLARVTDDRTRDQPPELRAQIAARLTAIKAPAIWVETVQTKVVLDAATERRVFGEALPPGLKLIA